MSEPIRYDFEQAELNKSAGFYVRKEGHWVRWDDHATALQEIQRLKAEVDRLTAEKDQAECDYDNCQKRKVSIDNHRFDLFNENKSLKAEVERLRKAGDAMAETLEGAGFDSANDFWNAAKEGKPHA